MRRALLALLFTQEIGLARSESCSADDPCPSTSFCNFSEGASGLCEACTTCTGEAPSGGYLPQRSAVIHSCGDCGLLDAGVANCADMCVGAYHGCMPGSEVIGDGHCEGCGAGKVGDGVLPCVACDEGKAASADRSRCESCSPGKQPSADKSRCESCVGKVLLARTHTYYAFGLSWLRNIYFEWKSLMVQKYLSQLSPNASYIQRGLSLIAQVPRTQLPAPSVRIATRARRPRAPYTTLSAPTKIRARLADRATGRTQSVLRVSRRSCAQRALSGPPGAVKRL